MYWLMIVMLHICDVGLVVFQKRLGGLLHTPSGALLTSGPSVALGSAPLMRHKMTFSHFSKDLIRPPNLEGQFAGAVIFSCN